MIFRRRTVHLVIVIASLLALEGSEGTVVATPQSGAAPASQSRSGGPGSNPVLPPSSLPDYVGTASQVMGKLPTGPLLTIKTPHGDVAVHNFYQANPPVNEAGDLVIKITRKYFIVVDTAPPTMNFWLGIKGKPFSTWRGVAEQDLLATLGVNKVDACKLSVTSGVIYTPGDPNDGKSFPLSFCGPGGDLRN